MKSITCKFLLASGLFLLPALSAQASVDSTLKLDLLCYSQLKTYTSEGNRFGITKIVRLDSKQLIFLMAKQANVIYPGGSQLQVAVNGQVFITNSNGDRLGNVSKYLQASFETTSRVYDGFRNKQTHQEASWNYFPASFTLNLPGVKGTVSGIASELYKVTAPNGYGVQYTTGHTDIAANGSGSFGGALAHYSGNLVLDGHKASINNP